MRREAVGSVEPGRAGREARGRVRQACVAGLLAVAAAACSDRPSGPPKPGSIRVTEGVGWEGKIVLGDPVSRVQKVLGTPDVVRTVGGEEELDYGFLEVTIEKGGGKVVGLLFREGWVTAAGLARGAKPEAVVAVYGALPTRWYPLMRYERRGVTFMLSPELTFDARGKPEGWVAHWAKVYPARR